MTYTSDHDGKSKTASAVDQDHYPEQHEVDNQEFEEEFVPAHAEIGKRAQEIWEQGGRQQGTSQQDWLQAEQELRAMRLRNPVQGKVRPSGSVQS